MSKKWRFRSRLLDIVKRLAKYDKTLGIINNGVDNAYPERIDRYINNSVTAKTAAKIMASYLAGKGFEQNKMIVNDTKELTLQKFTQLISKNFAKQRGVFISVQYNAQYKFSSLDVLPYSHCRLGKQDDNKYNGKIIVYDNWEGEDGKVDKEDYNVVDVFNTNEDVIQSQVDNVDGWNNYKGQILYVNLDEEYNYALSTIDPVIYDCDSEGQSSMFKNKSIRKGFFGKTLVITQPLAGTLDEYDNAELYADAVSERENFKETVEKFIGAENAGGVLHLELEHDGDNFDQAIKFENIASDIDDKLFEYTEASVFKAILLAFNSIPQGMIRQTDAVFGNSGEALKEMKLSYQDNTSQERDELEQLIQKLMSNFHKESGEFEIIPLIEEEEIKEETEIETDATADK